MSSSEPSAPFPEDGGDGDGRRSELPTCEAIQDAAPTLISISKISAPSANINQGRSPPKLFFPTESVCDSPSDNVGGPMDDSDSEDDEETNYKRSAEAVFNRVTLGILAVSLLWLSSLSTAVYITGYFVRLPRTSKVFSICQATSWALAQQARAFRACSERQLNTCTKDLDLAASAEQTRVDIAIRRNSQLISEAQARYSSSGAALMGTQNSLSQWQRHHVIPYNTDNATCPSDNRTQARALLGDVSASRTQIMAATSLYAKNGQDLVFQLVNFTIEYQTYHDEYLANKTATARSVVAQGEAMMDDANATYAKLIMQSRDVMSCLSSEPRGTCKLVGDTARKEMGTVVSALQGSIDTAQGALQTLQGDIVQYTDSVNTAYSKMKTFYEAAMETFTNLNLDPAMLGSAWSLGLADFYVDRPMWPDAGELLVDPITKSVDAIWQKVKEPVSALVGNLSAAQQRLERDAVEMREHLKATVLDAVMPDDYQPPTYPEDPREQLARFKLETENFMAQTGTSILDLSDQAQDASKDKAEAAQSNVTGTATSLKGLDFNFNIKYEKMDGFDVDIPSVFDVFGSITDVTFVCDYLYRAYSSLRLLRKFWNQSALELPTVDLRPFTLLKGFFSLSDCMLTLFSPNGFFARLLASGRLPYILLAAALIPIGIYLSVLYFLLYHDYRQGCVTHRQTEGSLLSRTVTSLGFNYAAMAGNQRMYDGLRTFHQSRVKMCAERSQSSNTKQLNAERYMTSLADGFADSNRKMHLLRSCLNTTALDEAFNGACCNQTEAAVTYDANIAPYMYPKCAPSASGARNDSDCPFNTNYSPARPYPPPSVGLSESSRFVNETLLANGGFMWALEDGRFDCGRLPSCPATCVGPNRDLVKLWSSHCSCTAEWLLHSYVLHTLLSLLVYLVLNASRLLLIGGLVRMRWRRYVSNQRLAFTAFVDTQGRPELLPEDMRHVSSRADKDRLLRLSPPHSPRINILHRRRPSTQPASPSDIDVAFTYPESGGGGGSSVDGRNGGKEDGLRPSAPPPPHSPDSSTHSQPMSPYEEHARRQQAFLRNRTLDTIRQYERWGRARTVLGVVLNAACLGSLSAVPSALEYAP